MPKFDKPDSPNIIWGVNALDADLTRPDDSYIQTGWTQVKPPYEYENYSMNKLYQGFAYYNQLGIPEWDSVTEYQSGKSYVQGSNNRVYKCIQTHVNRNPATAGNEIYWELFEGNRDATTSARGTVELATNPEAAEASLSSVVITPSNLISIFPLLSGGSESGKIEMPSNISGIKNTVIIQWGEVGYTDISGSRTVNITFPVSVSTPLFSFGGVDTAQNGVVVTRQNFTSNGVTFVLKEPDTNVIGGRLSWLMAGIK